MRVFCRAQFGLNGVTFRQSEEIEEWGKYWPDGEVSYRLNNFTRDIDKEYHQLRAVTGAWRTWQLRIDKLKLRRERNPDVEVDVDIAFRPLSYFSGRSTFAHAWFPGQGSISGNCEINDEWDWVTHSYYQTLAKPPLVPILTHEFGHSLGLVHDTSTTKSIMYPSFDLGVTKNSLHRNDINRIQGIYGKRSIPQRVIDMFTRYRNSGYDFR